MAIFCFLVDQRKQVRGRKPAAGLCSRCGGGAVVADMRTSTRFCGVPFYRKAWKAIVCHFCGAVLKSYHWVWWTNVLFVNSFVCFFFINKLLAIVCRLIAYLRLLANDEFVIQLSLCFWLMQVILLLKSLLKASLVRTFNRQKQKGHIHMNVMCFP